MSLYLDRFIFLARPEGHGGAVNELVAGHSISKTLMKSINKAVARTESTDRIPIRIRADIFISLE